MNVPKHSIFLAGQPANLLIEEQNSAAAVVIFLFFFFFSLFAVVVALALALGADAFFLLPPFALTVAVTGAVAVVSISFSLVVVVFRR
jgi:hypothetical protein